MSLVCTTSQHIQASSRKARPRQKKELATPGQTKHRSGVKHWFRRLSQTLSPQQQSFQEPQIASEKRSIISFLSRPSSRISTRRRSASRASTLRRQRSCSNGDVLVNSCEADAHGSSSRHSSNTNNTASPANQACGTTRESQDFSRRCSRDATTRDGPHFKEWI